MLGITPRETGNVWIWNGEDPMDDLQGSVTAAMVAHGLAPEQVEGRLFLDSGREQPLVLAQQTKSGSIIAEPVQKHLIQYLGDLKIIAAVIDPFVSSHQIPENDNVLMNAVAKTWARIADKANCAIDLVHHTRKNGGGEVATEDARGASALLSAVRGSRVVNRMTKDQAAKFNIPEGTRRRYFWVGGADSSLAAATEESFWHQLVAVHLGNGDPEGIGAVKRWKPAGLFDGTPPDLLVQVQKRVGEGNWRKDARANNWVGHLVAEVLGVDLSDKGTKARVSTMLCAWIKTGALRVVKHDDEHREEREFVVVGERPT